MFSLRTFPHSAFRFPNSFIWMFLELTKDQTNPTNPDKLASLSILIILMGSLGDITRGLCLVSHIKTNLPGSCITWLVEPKWADLVRFHPQIDKVIIFKRAWRISALWKLYRDLDQEHFDVTLDLQRILKSGFFSLLSGARNIDSCNAAYRFSSAKCQGVQLDF